jgi:peptide/nickel transport system substrate-binding protein
MKAGVATFAAGAIGLPSARAADGPTMVILSGIDIPNFDPHTASGYSTIWLMRNTYDTLVSVEGNPPNVVPRLAASWSKSDDGKEYTFKLDAAARFNGGGAVDAAAVKYSFERILRLNKGSAWMLSNLLKAEGIVVVDPTTIKFRLEAPFAPFLDTLAWFWIVDPKPVEANKGSDDGQTFLRTNIVGSGPFVIKRADPGNLYEIERVADGWRKGGGNLGGAVWKVTREAATQRLMIQRGEAHLVIGLTSEDMDALKGRPGITEVIEPEYRTFQMKMNTRYGPLMDVNLRRAISCAYNYDAMLQIAGYAELLNGPLPSNMFGFDKNLKPWRMDIEKAKSYLAKSSVKPGTKLSIVYLAGYEQQRRWALILLDSLKALGLDLDIRNATWADLVASCRSPETLADFFPVYQFASYPDPDNLAYAGFHSSRNGGFSNPVYANPAVDKLIEAARVETNDDRRAALYAQFQEAVMDDAPDIFGVVEKRKLAMRSSVSGYKFTPVAADAPELFPLSLSR